MNTVNMCEYNGDNGIGWAVEVIKSMNFEVASEIVHH